MSSTSVEYEFTLSSLEKNENVYLTEDRQYLYFNDLQNAYSTNGSEVKFELISLANTNQFVNWAESGFFSFITVFRLGIHKYRCGWWFKCFARKCFCIILEKWVPANCG
jgi:hypothetical protein